MDETITKSVMNWEKTFNGEEMAVLQHLSPFLTALVEEVARHVPKKGYGYLDAAGLGYYKMRADALADVYVNSPGNPGEALDSAAFLAFSWLHETGNIKEGL